MSFEPSIIALPSTDYPDVGIVHIEHGSVTVDLNVMMSDLRHFWGELGHMLDWLEAEAKRREQGDD